LGTINIYTEDAPGWILRRGAKEIQKAAPELVSINGKPADLNYFLNYATYRDVPGISVGMFTHLEEKGKFHERFLDVMWEVDHCLAMSRKTQQIINVIGMIRSVPIIRFGSDERLDKPILFGVVGRTYPSGRKGEFLVEKMVQAGFDVFSWGKGWPCPEFIGGSDWDVLPSFYYMISYLVITSTNEGGPIPVIDAIRAGVPVIAPRGVGWCDEFPCIRYEKGSWESLKSVLDRLMNPPTWEQWAAQHLQLFGKLLGTPCLK